MVIICESHYDGVVNGAAGDRGKSVVCGRSWTASPCSTWGAGDWGQPDLLHYPTTRAAAPSYRGSNSDVVSGYVY